MNNINQSTGEGKSGEGENKDYIINLRVSKATYEKIKRKARENRESISNLVRKTIEDSSEIVSDLADDMFGKRDRFKDIVGYHKFRTARELECSSCKSKIEVGSTATVGETTSVKKYFFCENCR